MDDRSFRKARPGVTVRRWFARVLSAAAVMALALPQPAQAWGYYGHQTIARIALANVTPRTRAAVARLIAQEASLGTPECRVRSLADAATWPDCLRGNRDRWAYTFAWHYQTEPVCEPYDVKANCANGNCVSAQIARALNILSDKTLPDARRLEALAFLAHFTGDIHMPLHSGDDDDRGGNDVKAAYGIAPGLNLHWIWDGALAERAITSAERPLVRRYSAAEKAVLAGGTIADWGRESWQLARTLVYPTAFGRDPCDGVDNPEAVALTQTDIEAQLPAARLRVEQAGLRLARLLDEALG